jgi:hypothetical protein
VDYHYLSWAYAKPEEIGIHGAPWNERARERKDILLDDEMSSQGSCWFMTKRHFTECLGGLSEVGYETFVQEFQEIGLKTWLGGGAVKINKKTWYAHLHKGKQYGRGYFISKGTMLRGTLYSADFWMNNRWPERKHNLEWLIEKFWPVPTWPANRAEWRTSNGTDITEPAARIVVPAPPPPPAPSVIAATPPAPAPKPTAVRVEGQQSDTIEAIFRIFHLTPDPLKRMPIEIPNAGRDRLAVLFAELGFTKGAEIGVEQGAYSEVLCKANPGLKVLYCVDAWQHYAGYRDHVNQQKLDGFYIATKARLAPYPAVLMRAFSLDAIKVFEPNGLDFCYIDAAHDLVSVINDLAAWSKLVRPGGIIAGHDYCRTKNDFQLHVVDAVNAFTNAYRISPWFLLGTKEERPGEIRDKRRSFLWVKR